jgi:hypothetical protein
MLEYVSVHVLETNMEDGINNVFIVVTTVMIFSDNGAQLIIIIFDECWHCYSCHRHEELILHQK